MAPWNRRDSCTYFENVKFQKLSQNDWENCKSAVTSSANDPVQQLIHAHAIMVDSLCCSCDRCYCVVWISISWSFSPILRIFLTSYHTQIKNTQIHTCLPSSAWFLRRIGHEPACHSLAKAFLTWTPQRLIEYLVWTPWIKAVSQSFNLLDFMWWCMKMK